ncbi:MAG: hypothetical protein EYX74_02000 [Desulfobulbaceae bacterium]|nr:MAG: hypothetical protein EYX74_02000 [Desulfobulbaceae bacterium]
MGSNRDFHQSLGQDPVSPLVFGLLLAPEDVPVTGARLRIFVNNRPVRDRVIAHAVAEGLHQQLLRGRQPVGVIFVRVDPATVDVNVHPTKREVRFQQSALVHDTVREAVSKGLIAHEQERGRTLFGSGNEGQTGEKFVFASSKANESETGSSGGNSWVSVEMQSMLDEMQAAGIFSRCPHGRPVFRRVGTEEFKKVVQSLASASVPP